MATSVEQRRLRYVNRQESQGSGVTLGFPVLDHHTNGLRPGELCAVGAFSKVGKTMFLANAAIQARKQGATPLFITLEMSKEEIEDRLDAIYSEVSYNRLTHGELTTQEVFRLRAAQDEFSQLGDLYIERPMEGERTVPHIVSRTRQLGADYLIIDQLSFMEPTGQHRELTSKHAEIVATLKKEIARDSAGQIPCLLAVQLNRASLNQAEGVGLQNFANTSVIEQTVDLAIGLSRSRDERANHLMRLDILGARRSEIQAWILRWELINETKLEVLGEAQ
jgi:replicative DNA helicase